MKIESHKPRMPTEVKPAGSQKQGVVANFYELFRALMDPSGKGQDYVPPLAAEDTDSPHFEPCETPARLIVGIPVTPLPVAMAQTAPLAEATEASQTGAVTAVVESVRSEVQALTKSADVQVSEALAQVAKEPLYDVSAPYVGTLTQAVRGVRTEVQPMTRGTDVLVIGARAQTQEPIYEGSGTCVNTAAEIVGTVRTEAQTTLGNNEAKAVAALAQVSSKSANEVLRPYIGASTQVVGGAQAEVQSTEVSQPPVEAIEALAQATPELIHEVLQPYVSATTEVTRAVRTEARPVLRSSDAVTIEAPVQVAPPPTYNSPSGPVLDSTAAMSIGSGVRIEAQPAQVYPPPAYNTPSRTVLDSTPTALAEASGGSANDRPGDIITRNHMPVAVAPGMRAETRTTQPSSSADAATNTPPQLGEGTQVHARGTIPPSPPVSEASLQALRMEIVSFVQSPSRPQVTLEIHPPEYGRVLVSGEVDPQGNVAVRLVVENNAVKEHVLLHLQRFPVPAEVEIMTFEEYREHGESRGRERREESPRQPPRRQDKSTTEFSV
ncbi:MAG: hypothetical protein KGZ66_02970 [Selenomonadales bacterium]|nr:hypothetical protein [Selenomonadales bacterium]